MTPIPVQLIIVEEGCVAFVPDYTLAVTLEDNCCVQQITQTPNPGSEIPQGEVNVILIGMDCSGNQTSMQFKVVAVDRVPPKFIISDSLVLNPLGQFGTDTRRWHLFYYVDTLRLDEYGNPITEIYYADSILIAQDHVTDTTGIHPNYWKNITSFKREFFTAESSYTLKSINLPLYREGTPGDVIVELYEMDENDEKVQLISYGSYEGIKLWTTTDIFWHTIEMNGADIIEGVKYAIEVHISQADTDNFVAWYTSTAVTPNNYLMYTYDNMATWGYNYDGDYMFEVWGYKNLIE